MKKLVVLVIIAIAATFLFWALFICSGDATTHEKYTLKDNYGQVVKTNAPLVGDKVERKATSKSKTANRSGSEDFETCVNNKSYLSVFKRLDGLGLGQENLAGRGHYQELTLDSLASYAGTGDPEATFLYGLELISKGLFGFYQTERYREYKVGTPEFKVNMKEHKVDIEKLKLGEDYLFKSAVQGKLLALGEIAAYFAIAVKELKEQGSTEKQISQFLVESHAYVLLMKDAFKKDAVILEAMAVDNKSLNTTLKIAFPGGAPKDVRELLLTRAKERFLELKERWKRNREYYGYDIYPDLFTNEEEMLYIKCN